MTPLSTFKAFPLPDIGVGRSQLDTGLIERAQTEVAAMHHIPTIEEIQDILSAIPGSMSETVVEEREGRF
jgi:hypothetical protein